jgi:TPR repeat protein
MLVIRQEQWVQVTRSVFEDQMVTHSRTFSPRLCQVLGDAQLRMAVRQAMIRAEGYGFTCRGPIRSYVELIFLFGSDFDSDPQYPGLRRILQSSEDQMLRAEWLYQEILDYQRQVSGPEAVNLQRALQAVLEATRGPWRRETDEFVAEAVRAAAVIYPEKARHLGDACLEQLAQGAAAEAKKHGFASLDQQFLLVALMYFLGHGCTRDPLYPWIGRALTIAPQERATRLQNKATTWLSHVLAAPWGGATA